MQSKTNLLKLLLKICTMQSCWRYTLLCFLFTFNLALIATLLVKHACLLFLWIVFFIPMIILNWLCTALRDNLFNIISLSKIGWIHTFIHCFLFFAVLTVLFENLIKSAYPHLYESSISFSLFIYLFCNPHLFSLYDQTALMYFLQSLLYLIHIHSAPIHSQASCFILHT